MENLFCTLADAAADAEKQVSVDHFSDSLFAVVYKYNICDKPEKAVFRFDTEEDANAHALNVKTAATLRLYIRRNLNFATVYREPPPYYISQVIAKEIARGHITPNSTHLEIAQTLLDLGYFSISPTQTQ